MILRNSLLLLHILLKPHLPHHPVIPLLIPAPPPSPITPLIGTHAPTHFPSQLHPSAFPIILSFAQPHTPYPSLRIHFLSHIPSPYSSFNINTTNFALASSLLPFIFHSALHSLSDTYVSFSLFNIFTPHFFSLSYLSPRPKNNFLYDEKRSKVAMLFLPHFRLLQRKLLA